MPLTTFPPTSRYRAPIPASAIAAVTAGGRAILTFKGINYHGSVWVGGKLVRANTSGAYTYHDVDITAALAGTTGAAPTAAVAVEVVRSYDWGLDCEPGRGLAPNEQASCRGRSKQDSLDLGITFVDWAPAPHDANLGLWRGVDLSLVPKTAPVTLRYPQVATRLRGAPSPTGGRTADLEILVEVQNWDPTRAVSGVLTAQIAALAISHQVKLEVPAATAVKVTLNVTKDLANADLWWPWQMGLPTQHNLTFAFAAAAPPSTAVGGAPTPVEATFLIGLREITGLNDDNNNLVVRVNSQRILIRGGGWGPDLLQRNTPQRNARQLLLTRDLGLNAIRLEGKLQDDDLFAQASAMGILMLPGICCCDAWQQWDLWTNATAATAQQSMASQLKRLRMHASVASFIYSSDELPPPHVEQGYLDVFAEERWAVGKVSSAADRTSTLTGHSGVKMAGPYGWVAPNYWYTDATTRDVGSAYGFATEISPGAAPLTLDSMVKTIPPSALWDPGSADGGPTADWNYHCGANTGAFGSLKHFTPAITARYVRFDMQSTWVWTISRVFLK